MYVKHIKNSVCSKNEVPSSSSVSFPAGQCELNQVPYLKGCVKTSPGLRVMDSYAPLVEERTSLSTSLSEWTHWAVPQHSLFSFTLSCFSWYQMVLWMLTCCDSDIVLNYRRGRNLTSNSFLNTSVVTFSSLRSDKTSTNRTFKQFTVYLLIYVKTVKKNGTK